jgi:hypothetical protein
MVISTQDSRLTAELDIEFEKWGSRPLPEIHLLILDAVWSSILNAMLPARCQFHLQQDAEAFFTRQKRHRLRPPTSNLPERLRRAVKRRSRVVFLFPKQATLLRLLTAIHIEVSQDRETGGSYLPYLPPINPTLQKPAERFLQKLCCVCCSLDRDVAVSELFTSHRRGQNPAALRFMNESLPQMDPAFTHLNQREKVSRMASKVLAEKNIRTPDAAISGRDIYKEATGLFPNAGVPQNTFTMYLSALVKDSASEINCMGRKQGYFLSSVGALLEAEENEIPLPEREERRLEKEALLYPALQNWLVDQGYRSDITAGVRGNGQWGNPDVVGLRCHECFGAISLEIASIEAKTSERNWRQWFFEAVSHRRFANRSYFAFAVPEELVPKLDPELRYYSERFQVGVLVVSMRIDLYEALHRGKVSAINPEDVDITELYSGQHSPVQPHYQRNYLNNLGLKNIVDIAGWGEGIDEKR